MEARHKGETILLDLSRAPQNWLDAGAKRDFIVDDPDIVRFFVTPLIGNNRSSFDIDISRIPKRPNKATRIEIECIIPEKAAARLPSGIGDSEICFRPAGSVLRSRLI